MEKSVFGAVLLGLLIPGAGNLYVKDTGPGIGLLVGFIVSLVLIPFLVGIFILPILWVVSGILAYSAAKNYNKELERVH